ncbi:MAG: hypothetical protein ACE5F6_05345 [Anaerolineae bacterium]
MKTTKRFWLAIALLLAITLSLTGCGGQSTGGTLEGIASGALDVVAQYMPHINLPRITLAYDDTGVPAVFGVKTPSLARFVPLDLKFVELSPDTLQWLMDRDVQHVELDLNEAGLFLYVNGKAMPYLAWNQDRLAYASELLDRLDVVQYDTTIAKAAPLLGRVGVDLLATFPKQAGASSIPPRERSQRAVAEKRPVGEPTAVIQGVVEYGDDGVPSVAGITSREIAQLARLDLRPVELTPEIIDLVKRAGVQEVEVVSESDGLHLGVNKRELVQVAYNEQHLMNAINLYAQLAGDEQSEVFAAFLRNIAPIVYGADIDVVFQFPGSK